MKFENFFSDCIGNTDEDPAYCGKWNRFVLIYNYLKVRKIQ